MNVSIIGGGPAGLLFSALFKEGFPSSQVRVYERNPSLMTYGFGVCLSKGALKFLQTIDSLLSREIVDFSLPLEHITLTHQERPISIKGHDFYGIERIKLLHLLKSKALRKGVEIFENHPIETISSFKNSDLIVGADGINSQTRSLFLDHFQPIIKECQNRLIWYGTSQISQGIELIFKQTSSGIFIGHTYRYREDRNTFIVECPPDTWNKAGLGALSEEGSKAYCETIFSDFLKGHSLISNRSSWFNPKIISTTQWTHNHITLIGDALKTMHPSIGSGTYSALKDAVVLAQACFKHPTNLSLALQEFENIHKKKTENLQNAALMSVDWYEKIQERIHLLPYSFAYDYILRTGKLSESHLYKMDAEFMRAYKLEKSLIQK